MEPNSLCKPYLRRNGLMQEVSDLLQQKSKSLRSIRTRSRKCSPGIFGHRNKAEALHHQSSDLKRVDAGSLGSPATEIQVAPVHSYQKPEVFSWYIWPP